NDVLQEKEAHQSHGKKEESPKDAPGHRQGAHKALTGIIIHDLDRQKEPGPKKEQAIAPVHPWTFEQGLEGLKPIAGQHEVYNGENNAAAHADLEAKLRANQL